MARTTIYSPQFKAEVVLQLLQGKNITAASSEYNIHPNILRRWLREFQDRAYMVFDYAAKHKAEKNDDTPPAYKEKYPSRIRSLREEYGSSQEQTAKLLGISQTMYARYESGYSKMPIKYVVILAKHYNVSTDYILGVSEKKL